MQDTPPTTATTTLPYQPASQSLITLYHSPAKDLAGIFARYQNVVWRLGEDHSGPGMEAIAPTTILASEDGWIIRSSGRAPQLLLPAIASLSGRPLMLAGGDYGAPGYGAARLLLPRIASRLLADALRGRHALGRA